MKGFSLRDHCSRHAGGWWRCLAQGICAASAAPTCLALGYGIVNDGMVNPRDADHRRPDRRLAIHPTATSQKIRARVFGVTTTGGPGQNHVRCHHPRRHNAIGGATAVRHRRHGPDHGRRLRGRHTLDFGAKLQRCRTSSGKGGLVGDYSLTILAILTRPSSGTAAASATTTPTTSSTIRTPVRSAVTTMSSRARSAAQQGPERVVCAGSKGYSSNLHRRQQYRPCWPRLQRSSG